MLTFLEVADVPWLFAVLICAALGDSEVVGRGRSKLHVSNFRGWQHPDTDQSASERWLAIVMSTVVLHLALGLVLKLYFFTYFSQEAIKIKL